eukprot:2040174-Prymnesium_polylepis.1
MKPSMCLEASAWASASAGPGVAHAVDRVLYLLVVRECGGGGREMHGELEGILLDLQYSCVGFQAAAALGCVPVEVGRGAERAVRAVAVVAL